MSIVNKGNVSEGILGCTLVAKFTARQGSVIRNVTPSDVRAVWTKLKGSRIRNQVKEISEHVYDVNRGAQDTVRITIRLGEQTAKDLFSEKALDEMSSIVSSACAYVNSPKMHQEAMEFFMNMVEDKIDIAVDGITKASATKADIIIKDNSIVVDRLSVKSGEYSSTIGQVGGDVFPTFVRLFHGGMNPKTGSMEPGLGLNVNTPSIQHEYERLRGVTKTKENLQRATAYIYAQAAYLLAQVPTSSFVPILSKFIAFHAAKHDPSIQIVVLEKIVGGRFEVLDPNLLDNNLKKLSRIRVNNKNTGAWPILIVYDADMKQPETRYGDAVLFVVRVHFANTLNKMSNLIEKGPRLDSLIQVH
jgi:hypothetical protein